MKSSLASSFSLIPAVYNQPVTFFDKGEETFFRNAVSLEKPDIVSIRGLDIDGVKALNGSLSGGCKISVVGIHGFASDVINQSKAKKAIKHRLIEIPTLEKCTGFYTVCDDAFTSHRWLNRYKKKYLGTIYNYVEDIDPKKYVFARSRLRKNLQIPDEGVLGIYVGRIDEEKGLLYLSRALIELFKTHQGDNFFFAFVGDGPIRKKIEALLKTCVAMRKVFFLGSQEDVWPFLFSSDVFVFPSLRENHPLSILEACEAGLYILSTDVGGVKETVLPNVNASLVPPFNSDAILNELISIIVTKKYLRFDKTAWPVFKEGRFDQSTYCEKMESVYRRLLLCKTMQHT